MFDEVLSSLVKGRYNKFEAELRGYTRQCVKGEHYPGLMRARRGNVQGSLIVDISADDLDVLDEFEGRYYKRTAVTVRSENRPIVAEAYVFRSRFRCLLSESAWCPQQFRREFLTKFVDRYVLKSG